MASQATEVQKEPSHSFMSVGTLTGFLSGTEEPCGPYIRAVPLPPLCSWLQEFGGQMSEVLTLTTPWPLQRGIEGTFAF